MKDVISLEVEYDEVEEVILSALKRNDLTVHQLGSIISYSLDRNISYGLIVKKLGYLRILGKVSRIRKNNRIFIYSYVHFSGNAIPEVNGNKHTRSSEERIVDSARKTDFTVQNLAKSKNEV